MAGLTEIFDDVKHLIDFISDKHLSHISVNVSAKGISVMNGEILLSALGTLDTILLCYERRRFSDANVLLRKFRDDLFQFLFIIEALKLESSRNQAELKKILSDIDATELSEQHVDSILNLIFDEANIAAIREEHGSRKAVDAWFHNEIGISDNSNIGRKYLGYERYIEFLKKIATVDRLFADFIGNAMNRVSRQLNNYMHANGKRYLLANTKSVYVENSLLEYEDELEAALLDIMRCFLSIIILTEPSLCQSDDYVDYLDAEMTPPEGSQYWVAPCVQSFIDKYIYAVSPEWKNFIVTQNPYGMIFS